MAIDDSFLELREKFINEGRRFAVISVVNTQTSVPQEAPQKARKLILCENGQAYGSLGYKELDIDAIAQAKACLASGIWKLVWIEKMPLRIEDPLLDLGKKKIEVFIEIYEPPSRLILIGTENIGLEIAKIAQNLDFNIIIIDEGSKVANMKGFAMPYSIICEPNLELALSSILGRSSYIIINSQFNYERAVRYCLGKEWAYCGIIGSKKKIASLRKKLVEEGFSTEQLKSINAPIGLDIGALSQYEIAISVIAEIIAVKHNKKDIFMKSIM